MESYHRVVPHHTLEIDGKLSLAKKPSLDGNLIIEGDNLIALKSLLPTHAGKIKCIYIDPPYNTGNEGWIYNDNLTQPQFKEWIGNLVGKEGEDACRHDKWCCMMYPRLQLLKELLRDDGAIFISIDDNEVHHLRMWPEPLRYSIDGNALAWIGPGSGNSGRPFDSSDGCCCWQEATRCPAATSFGRRPCGSSCPPPATCGCWRKPWRWPRPALARAR